MAALHMLSFATITTPESSGEGMQGAIPAVGSRAAARWALAAQAQRRCPVVTIQDEVTHVRDGDTIVVGRLPIRLHGIAAPDRDEPGGDDATKALSAMVVGRQLLCELNGARSRDRCVAVCYLRSIDIAETVVLAGLARDCPRFSVGRYVQAERQAAAEGTRIRRAYELPEWCQ